MPNLIDGVNQRAVLNGLPDDIFDALHAVMHLHRTAEYRNGPHELTHLEGKALGFFGRRPGATQKDLALHLGRDKGQLARLISGLKERDLLVPHVDEIDRRNIRLHLTAGGRAAQQVLERRRRRLSELAVKTMSHEERHRLLTLLLAVRGNLEGFLDDSLGRGSPRSS